MSRRALDRYETAPWQVDALVDHLPELSGSICCPCVGDGSLLKRLRERRPDLGPFITNDLNEACEANYHGDATIRSTWAAMFGVTGHGPDWVIENPPFNVEIDIAKHAYEVARCGVVLMARLSFVEGTKPPKPRKDGKPRKGVPYRPRGPWLAAHPRQQQIALERYSFTGDGQSDSASTEWLVWSKVPLSRPGCHTAYGYKSGEAQRADRNAPLLPVTLF